MSAIPRAGLAQPRILLPRGHTSYRRRRRPAARSTLTDSTPRPQHSLAVDYPLSALRAWHLDVTISLVIRGGVTTRVLECDPPAPGVGGEGSSCRRGLRSFGHKSHQHHEASPLMRGCLVVRLVALAALWHCSDALVTPGVVTPGVAVTRVGAVPSLFGTGADVFNSAR